MRSKVWIVTPDRFLRPEQTARLRDEVLLKWSAGTSKQRRDATILEVLLGTGLRVSEVCELQLRDLHLQGDEPAVFVRNGKGGRPRLVPISSMLAATVRRYLDGGSASQDDPMDRNRPVFLGQHGVGLTRFGVTKMWKSALRAAGLPNRWGIHATRHTYALEVYRRTRDLRMTQRLLGHTSPSTTMVYAALLDEDVRVAVETIWT